MNEQGKIYSEGWLVYRGKGRTHPLEMWSFDENCWKAYAGKGPKPIDYGHELSQEEFEEMKKIHAERAAKRAKA